MTARNSESGSAMLVTLIIIAALLAGAVVLVSMQLASNRSTDLSRTSVAAVYCAEAGLHAARGVIASSEKSSRTTAIDASGTITIAAIAANTTPVYTEPDFLKNGIGSHDLDGDGVADFEVYLVDNDDELPRSDYYSKCPQGRHRQPDLGHLVLHEPGYSETPKKVSELVNIADQKGTMYDWQAGGAMGNNNYNFQNTTY